MLALPLLVVLVGGLQASVWAIGRELQRRTLAAVVVITLVTTLVVVFHLFIVRPGASAGAFGGYSALIAQMPHTA